MAKAAHKAPAKAAPKKPAKAAEKAKEIIARNRKKQEPVQEPVVEQPAVVRQPVTAAAAAAMASKKPAGIPDVNDVMAAMTGINTYDNKHRHFIREELKKQVAAGAIYSDMTPDQLHDHITQKFAIDDRKQGRG